jgi:hypothetical protein
MEYNIFTILVYSILLLLTGSIPAIWIKFYTKSNSVLLNIFFSNIFVALLIVFIFSACKSHFNSVFLLVLLPVVLYYFTQRPVLLRPEIKSLFKTILGLLPVALLTTFIAYIHTFPKSIEGDVLYYSKIASYLYGHGKENYYHYYNDALNTNLGLMPYHYFELWLSSLFGSLTGFTTLLALKFIVYPYLITLLIIGISGLHEHLTQKKAGIAISLLILAFTLSAGYFGELLSIKCSGWDILLSVWTRPNFILYSLGLILIILSLKDENYYLLTLSSMIVCLFSVTAIPAVLAAFFLFLFLKFCTKDLQFKKAVLLSVTLSLFVLFYFLFYYINHGNFSLIESKPISGIIAVAFKIWKATVGTFLNITIRSLLFTLLFIYLTRKNFLNKDIVAYFALLIVSSVGAFQLLSQLDNSYQIPHFGFCLLSILLILSILYFLRNLNAVYLSILLLPALYFGYTVNKEQLITKDNFCDNRPYFVSQKGIPAKFVEEVANKLNTEKGICGFYLDSEKIQKTEPRYRTEVTLQPMLELAYYTDNNNMIGVNEKTQITQGDGRGIERLDLWYKLFPNFSTEKNPFTYLAGNKINALLINKKGMEQIGDSTSYSGYSFIADENSSWLYFYTKK